MRLDVPSELRARLDPAERYGLRVTLIGLAIVIVAIPFASLTFQVLAKGPLTRFDGQVADQLNHWVRGHPGVISAMKALSLLGRPPVLAIWVAAASVWTWQAGRHRLTVFLLVTSIGGGIVDSLVKLAVDRPRPIVDHPVTTAFGKSFPSGHAMSATVTYGALLIVLGPFLRAPARRLATVLVALLIVAIGCSRLILGVHFVTDVVGGSLLGLAWLAGATGAFEAWRHDIATERRWRRRRRRAALEASASV